MSQQYSLPNAAAVAGTAVCPAGTVATGGGAIVGTGGGSGLVLSQSQPTPLNGTPNGWVATGENTSGAASTLTVTAICATT